MVLVRMSGIGVELGRVLGRETKGGLEGLANGLVLMYIRIAVHVLEDELIGAIVATEYGEIRKTVDEHIRDLVHFELNTVVDYNIGKVEQLLLRLFLRLVVVGRHDMRDGIVLAVYRP